MTSNHSGSWRWPALLALALLTLGLGACKSFEQKASCTTICERHDQCDPGSVGEVKGCVAHCTVHLASSRTAAAAGTACEKCIGLRECDQLRACDAVCADLIPTPEERPVKVSQR